MFSTHFRRVPAVAWQDVEDPTLDAIRRLSTRVCDDVAKPATREVIEKALAELEARFSELTTRVPRGEHVPIDELVALLARQRAVLDSLPTSVAYGSQKYVPEETRVRRWAEIVWAFDRRLDDLRYEVLRAKSSNACDCLALVELGTNARKPQSPKLRRIGYDWDGYYNAAAWVCDECGTRWSHATEDTESQHVEWWEPKPSTWEPKKPPS